MSEAAVITVTRAEDGSQRAHLPLPERLLMSPLVMALGAGELVETHITFKFANVTARYRVTGDQGPHLLVAELLEQHFADEEAARVG